MILNRRFAKIGEPTSLINIHETRQSRSKYTYDVNPSTYTYINYFYILLCTHVNRFFVYLLASFSI